MGDSLDLLTQLFARQTTSLGQYMAETSPWMESEADPSAVLLDRIINQERGWITALSGKIEACGGVPIPGNYPIEFTDHHFLSLDFLLPRLSTSIERSIVFLRGLLDSEANSSVQELIQTMIAGKEKQLTELKDLSVEAPNPEAAD